MLRNVIPCQFFLIGKFTPISKCWFRKNNTRWLLRWNYVSNNKELYFAMWSVVWRKFNSRWDDWCYLNIDWYITGLVIVVVLYYSTSLSPSPLYKIIFQFFFLSWYFLRRLRVFFPFSKCRCFCCCRRCMACRKNCWTMPYNSLVAMAVYKEGKERIFLHFIHLNILILIFYVPSSTRLCFGVFFALHIALVQIGVLWGWYGIYIVKGGQFSLTSLFLWRQFFLLINSSLVLSTWMMKNTTKALGFFRSLSKIE